MVIYKINIKSVIDGIEQINTAEGEVFQDNQEVIFKFGIDGDKCKISAKGSKAVYERRGEQYVKITFEEGRKTLCEIGSVGFCGSYEIFTKSLKFISGKGGYKLSLEYLNGNENQLIKLTFTAVKKG